MNPMCETDDYYVVAIFNSGLVPLGTFSKEYAEYVKRDYEEKQRFNPLFEYVSMSNR